MSRLPTLLVALMLVLVAGCRADPLRVDAIQLGRSLNPDNSVANHTTTFTPSDTVYLAVLTAAPGAGTISVRWSYGSQVIDEPSREVSYRDAAATSSIW
jgi:hypothetical protein